MKLRKLPDESTFHFCKYGFCPHFLLIEPKKFISNNLLQLAQVGTADYIAFVEPGNLIRRRTGRDPQPDDELNTPRHGCPRCRAII